MPQPHLNIVVLQGQIIRRARLEYVGPRQHQARVRYRVQLRRPHRASAGKQGYESTVIPCEMFGRIAEEWIARVGEGSWLTLEGRLRSYRISSSRIDIYLVVTRFNILEPVAPARGYEKRSELHKPHTQTPLTGLAHDGDGD